MSPTVRPAEATDLEDLVALLDMASAELLAQRGGEAFLAGPTRRHAAPSALEAALHDDSIMVWCGIWESAVVGYAIAEIIDEGDGRIVELTDVFTIPDAREVGVGEVLVEAAIAWAIACEARAIDAHTLPGARATKNLYERLGLTARLITARRDLP